MSNVTGVYVFDRFPIVYYGWVLG